MTKKIIYTRHLGVKNIDKKTPIDILIDEGYEEEAEIILNEYNHGKYGKHAFDNLKEKMLEEKKKIKRQQKKEMEEMLPERRRDHRKYSRMMYVNGHFIVNKPYQKVSKQDMEIQAKQNEQLQYNKRYGKKQVNDGTIDDIVMRKIRSEMKAEVLGVNDAKKVFSP